MCWIKIIQYDFFKFLPQILVALAMTGLYAFAPKGTIEDVIEEHIGQLEHLAIEHPPLLVLFSGTPGMGKSTIATRIAQELKAIKIVIDDVRELWKKHGIAVTGSAHDKRMFTINYLEQLIITLAARSPNRFIILDSSVDRSYSSIKTLADQYGFPTVVIRLLLTKDEAIERIKQREVVPEEYIRHMDGWYQDYQRFDLTRVDYFYDTRERWQEFIAKIGNHLAALLRR